MTWLWAFMVAGAVETTAPTEPVAHPPFTTWAEQLQPPPDRDPVADNYRFAHEVFGPIGQRVAAKPDVVEVENFGTSTRGKPLWAFHVRDPSTPVTRKVLVFAGIHALEWISTEVATDLLLELIERPVPGVQVTVVPLLNPDGRTKVEVDLRHQKNTYRRGNGPSVDLNRDFAVHTEATAIWKAIIPGYYSHSETPLSQPESQALDRLLDRQRYDRAASLHAFGGFFYTPWSGRFSRIPKDDRDEHWRIGRAMEQAQGSHAYKTRQLGRWGFFFRAHGSELDHIYGTYGTTTYLVELTRSGIRPWRRKDWGTYFRWYNPVGVERHRQKGVAAMKALIWTP